MADQRVIDMPAAGPLSGADIFYLIQNSSDDVQSTLDAIRTFLGAGGASPVGTGFNFNDVTTDTDPGDGRIAFDNATQLSTTTIRVDNLDADGVDITDLLDELDDSSSTVKGYIRLVNASDATKWIIFRIDSISVETGYYNITVSVVVGSGVDPFSNFDFLTLSFTRTGDKGNVGSRFYFGTTVPAGGLGVDDDVYLRTTTYDLYQKIASVWTIIGNLKGTTGAAGDGIASYAWLSERPPVTGTKKRFYTDRDGTILWCRAEVQDGDGSSTSNFDVRKNGSSIYPTSTKPSVSAGQFLGAERVPDTIDFVKGDYFEPVVTDTGGTSGRLRLLINFSYEGV